MFSLSSPFRSELSKTRSSDRSVSNGFIERKTDVRRLLIRQRQRKTCRFSFNESFCSAVLTSIIEDLILRSSLASDYLLSQPIIIGQIEHSLPFIRNIELENELLSSSESFLLSSPFATDQELEEFLTHCGRKTHSTFVRDEKPRFLPLSFRCDDK